VRPTVSVIVPFVGSQDELEDLVSRLRGLALAEGDEIVIADNRPGGRPPADVAGLRWVPAPEVPVAAFPRNAGAAAAGGEWLVFVDCDTEPQPGLVDAYFSPAPAEDAGLLAGGIDDVAARPTLTARYVVARGKMDQGASLANPRGPYAQTANCAVRRAAFEQVGGFDTSIRWAEDPDLCWRLQDAGWKLEERPGARVAHRARESVRGLLVQMTRHGRGAGWAQRRYPGSFPPPTARQLVGRAGHYGRRALRALRGGDRTEASFLLLDLACLYAFDLGRRLSNDPPTRRDA